MWIKSQETWCTIFLIEVGSSHTPTVYYKWTTPHTGPQPTNSLRTWPLLKFQKRKLPSWAPMISLRHELSNAIQVIFVFLLKKAHFVAQLSACQECPTLVDINRNNNLEANSFHAMFSDIKPKLNCANIHLLPLSVRKCKDIFTRVNTPHHHKWVNLSNHDLEVTRCAN